MIRKAISNSMGEKVYHDDTRIGWGIDSDIHKLGLRFGELVAVFITKQNWKDKRDSERWCFKEPDYNIPEWVRKELKPNEMIVRYITRTSMASQEARIIKIDTKKGLVYFLKDYDVEEWEFEKKGLKVEYMRVSK